MQAIRTASPEECSSNRMANDPRGCSLPREAEEAKLVGVTGSRTTTHGSTVEQWMRGLAESTGSPGGGAAAGVMLAIALGLTSMVAGYSEPAEPEGELAALRGRARSRVDNALRLADDDASASEAFGSAFAREPGQEREDAIEKASLNAARASATLGDHAAEAIGDLEWLASHGNRALISDVTVAFGALRAAVVGARTNVSFDLAAAGSAGESLDQVRENHPALWATVKRFDAAIARIDRLTADIDDRAAPTG